MLFLCALHCAVVMELSWEINRIVLGMVQRRVYSIKKLLSVFFCCLNVQKSLLKNDKMKKVEGGVG